MAYWEPRTVQIFNVRPNEPLKAEIAPDSLPALPALARSLQLYNFGKNISPKGPDFQGYLICGLADGSVVHFAWDAVGHRLSDRKVISLGNSPVHLTVCQVDGKKAIFAAGDRATVLSTEKGKLVQSPVMLKV